jgi:peptidoglycan/xylan/chitin deacetylase (PgdA/CDA1 family)
VSIEAASTASLRSVADKHLALDAFVAHLKTLRKAWRVISLEDMVRGLRNAEDLRGTVAITFDDGYENNFLHAAPALSDFKMPATFFLTTGFVGTGAWIWTDLVENLLLRSAVKSVRFSVTDVVFPLTTVGEKRHALREIKAVLKRAPSVQRVAALAELETDLAVHDLGAPTGDDRFLNWDQVRKLAEAGFEIGGHTVTHPILSTMPLAEAQREILDSCAHIRSEIGRCSPTFCYPNGKSSDYGAPITAFCAEHFEAALSTNRGVASAEEMFELRRLGTPTGARAAALEWLLFRER